jgi:hypothetical protein
MRSSKLGCGLLRRNRSGPMEDRIKHRDSNILTEGPDGTISEIRRVVEVLIESGDVAELRTFQDGKTTSGYFDDYEAPGGAGHEGRRLGIRRLRDAQPGESGAPGSSGQTGSGGVQGADYLEFVPLGQRHLGHPINRFKKEGVT